jgi:hypothetical protein
MRPDTHAPLALAAARRHELTRAKAIQALRELDRSGAPVSYAAVAGAAPLTELQGIAAGQKAERSWRRITMLSGMPESAAAHRRDLGMGATESGHTELKRSPTSPRCCSSGASHDRPLSLQRCL